MNICAVSKVNTVFWDPKGTISKIHGGLLPFGDLIIFRELLHINTAYIKCWYSVAQWRWSRQIETCRSFEKLCVKKCSFNISAFVVLLCELFSNPWTWIPLCWSYSLVSDSKRLICVMEWLWHNTSKADRNEMWGVVC